MKTGYLLAVSCLGLLARPATAQNTYLDPTFQRPVILNGTTSGVVNDVVQQPDGKYLVGGSFTSINGVRARNLARLNADGTLDAAFTASCRTNGTVLSLALQADGSLVAGGQFDSLANAPRQFLGRVLPTGTLDAAFLPTVPAADGRVNQVAIAPGGDVLSLTASGPRYGVSPTGLRRFGGATGQPVPGFVPAVDAISLTLQPDGKILTTGAAPSYVPTYMVARLLPNGSLDPSFAHQTNAYTAAVWQVGLAANGDLYTAGNWYGGAQLVLSEMTGPQGRLGVGGLNQVFGFTFQPNGRLLLQGQATGTGQPVTSRILPGGQVDASYVATNGPVDGSVRRFLVQPDGAIMLAGSFTLAGTTPVYGLVRMRDANVLASRAAAPIAALAWPVPATTVLHVPSAAAPARQVQLLDALGHLVLTSSAPSAPAGLDLDVAALAAGVYTLRVFYDGATSPATQRVVLAR